MTIDTARTRTLPPLFHLPLAFTPVSQRPFTLSSYPKSYCSPIAPLSYFSLVFLIMYKICIKKRPLYSNKSIQCVFSKNPSAVKPLSRFISLVLILTLDLENRLRVFANEPQPRTTIRDQGKVIRHASSNINYSRLWACRCH